MQTPNRGTVLIMRWRLSLVVRRSLHSVSRFRPIMLPTIRNNTTLLDIMQEHLPELSLQPPPNPPQPQQPPLNSVQTRRERFQETVDSKLKERSVEELTDACRSLLYGKRFAVAERLFQDYLQSTSTAELDVDFCNVFVEHYLFHHVNHEQAMQVYHRLGRRANLDTHLQFIRFALRKGDLGTVKEHLVLAVDQGVPTPVILGMPMWTGEERLLLRPLITIGRGRDGVSYDCQEILSNDDPIRINLPVLENKPTDKPNTEEFKITRAKSQLGGIDLMAEMTSIFTDLHDKTEEELLHAQRRLEEASMEASRQLEHRRRQMQAKMTGMPEAKGMYSLLTIWSSEFAIWLRDEMERRLERGFTGTTATDHPHVFTDKITWTQSDADYFCALLCPLPAEKIALITVSEMLSIKGFDPELGGVKTVTVAKAVGRRVREEMLATVAVSRPFLERLPIHPQMVKQLLMGWHGRRRVENAVHMAMTASQERIIEQSQEAWLPSWSSVQAVQLGSWLLSCALHTVHSIHFTHNHSQSATADKQEPPFRHAVVYDYRTGHRQGVIRPSASILRQLLSASTTQPETINSISVTDPWALPMLVPPRPWLTFSSGGYITRRSPFVRLKDDPMHAEVLKSADAEGLLETVKRGLDVLGQTAWSINKDILRLQVEFWNERVDPRTLTTFPSHSPTPPTRPAPPADKTDPQQRNDYIAAMQTWQRQRAAHTELVSAQCDTNYKLEIAKMFANARQFYMPHTVDFRGRAYTIPPHLSHISSDAARGLLLFAESRELGERGLFWLKVHLANLYGFDKASMAERAAWTDERVEVIKRTARSPKTEQFWRDADEPWQCLAACIELANALEYPEGPHRYPCKLPIQQDGSCNGLQHYAALGRDPEGAAKVNLAPSERPQDVYRSVADLVQSRLQEDLKPTSTITADERLVAAQLVGKVNRKIVKTTVMTNVYGVTEYGAREQLSLRMKEAGLFTESKDHHLLLVARSYLARLVFASLKELFVRAKAIQDWLTLAANEIVHAVPEDAAVLFGFSKTLCEDGPDTTTYRRPVMEKVDWRTASIRQRFLARYPQTMVAWSTPLGFPVVQPYSRTRHVRLHTALQNITVRSPTLSDPVDPTKQAAAFPPNFVHSLDASHMFMTALECNRLNIAFASVHDCFWTHAATVDEMSRVIRQQFVKLYGEDVLSKLRAEFEVRYRGYLVPVKTAAGRNAWRRIHFPPVPGRGPFDLNLVLESDYFFS